MVNNEDVYTKFPLQSFLCIGHWPDDTPEARDKLANAVTYWGDMQERRKWPLALHFFRNYAYLKGNPFIHFNYDGSRLNFITPAGGGNYFSPNVVTNYLIRPYEGNVSIFTQTKPYPKVTPASSRPEDEDAARGVAAIISALWEDPLRMQAQQRSVVSDLLLCGTAAFETTYTELPIYETIKTKEGIAGENISFQAKKDVQVFAYSPFEINPDPGATSTQDSMSWIMVSSFRDKGWIKDMYDRDAPGYYPENLDKMSYSSQVNSPLYWRYQVKTLVDTPENAWFAKIPNYGIRPDGSGPNEVLFRIIDVKPTPNFPQGRTIVVAGNQLLYCGPSRAWSEKYPETWTKIRVARYRTVPGCFWGDSLFNSLIRPQKRINSIDQMLQEYRKSVFIQTLLVPSECKIPDGYITQTPRQVVPYKGEKAPTLLENQAFPPEILKERGMCEDYISAASGINKIMAGENQQNVRCWAEGSSLLDKYGRPIAVEDLFEGNDLATVLGHGPIGLVHKNAYNGEMITINPYNSLPMTVTPNHRFPTSNGIKQAKDITLNDCLLMGFSRPRDGCGKIEFSPVVSLGFKPVSPVPLAYSLEDPDFLWFCGFFLAEGCTDDNRVIFSCGKKETTVIEKITRVSEQLFGITPKVNLRLLGTNIHINNRTVAQNMRSLFGEYAHTKQVPEEIMSSPGSVLPLVAGWLDGDGNLDKQRLRGTTVSFSLASQIHAILWDEKIVASLKKFKGRPCTLSKHDSPGKDVYVTSLSGEEAKRVTSHTVRWPEYSPKLHGGAKGVWKGDKYYSQIKEVGSSDYIGNVFNVTMNDFEGADNTVVSACIYSQNSADMLQFLRTQALQSKDAVFQEYEEVLQDVASDIVKTVIEFYSDPELEALKVKVLASNRNLSTFSFESLKRMDLRDNTTVKFDIRSKVMVEPEAKAENAKMLIQYLGPALNPLQQDTLFRAMYLDELVADTNVDVERARRQIAQIKSGIAPGLIKPIPGVDRGMLMAEEYRQEIARTAFMDLPQPTQAELLRLFDAYNQMAAEELAQQQLNQQLMARAPSQLPPAGPPAGRAGSPPQPAQPQGPPGPVR